MFPDKVPVLITWIDACSETARMHQDPDALANVVLARMCNIGYILHEDADRIILAHGKGSTEEIDVFVIPVNSILERVEINGEEETDQEDDSEETQTPEIFITDPVTGREINLLCGPRPLQGSYCQQGLCA